MKKKKVLFVATVVQKHIMVFHLPYLNWFKQNGYETHVCAANDYENKVECNIPFCDYFFELPFEREPLNIKNLTAYKQLREILSINKYEVIHCHTPVGGVIGRLAAHNTKNVNTKVIYTAHGFHFYKGAPLVNWLLYYPVEKWLARYTDVLITINAEDFNIGKKMKANVVEYVPGVGVDLELINSLVIDNKIKRKELGINSSDFIILSVGELNKNKNQEVIIRAMSQVKNKNIKYLLCGKGPLEDELKKIAKELNVDDQVCFLGYRNDVSELCKISDLFAFPSIREGLSLALMEAMAAGLPVICSKIRGNIDLIEHKRGGYLVNPKDTDSFAVAIKLLLESEHLTKSYGNYNKRVIMNYSKEKVFEKMSMIYNNLI